MDVCVVSSSHGVVYKAINRLNGSLAAVKKLVRPLSVYSLGFTLFCLQRS
jgi:hypothetical protein